MAIFSAASMCKCENIHLKLKVSIHNKHVRAGRHSHIILMKQFLDLLAIGLGGIDPT